MEIEGNPNIKKYTNSNGDLIFEIIPYDRELDVNYVAEATKAILDSHKEHFVISAQGYVFDGLYDTSRLLIENGCIIYNTITQETAEI